MSFLNRASVILVISAAALLLVWFASPLLAPPLYDGLQLPPQPYRYLSAPPGQRNPGPPSRARLEVTLSGTKLSFEDVATLETPPQARMVLQDNSIHIAKGVRRVIFTIGAVPPPSQPADATIDGNVYRLAVQADTGAKLILRKQQARVELRGTGLRGSPMVEQYGQGRWIRLTTGKFLGLNIFTANINTLGDYALVIPGKGNVAAGGSSPLPFVIVGALIIALAVVSLLLVRLSRTRGSSSPPATST